MPSIFSHIADLILAKPGTLSKIILVLMVISLFGLSMVSMSTGNENYLRASSPEGILNNHYSDKFQKDAVILLIESGDSTSPSLLKYIDSIEKPILNLQYISSISSISDVVKSLNNQVIPASSGEMKNVMSKVPESAIQLYTPTGMLNLVQINLESGLALEKRKAAISNLQNFLDSTNTPPGVSIKITGTAAFKQQMEVEMGKSLGVLIMAAMILMVIIMGLLFGYVNHRFIPVFIVAAGLLFSFGFIGLSGMKISLAVISAFPVIIGLGIDYAIQFHSRLEEEARNNPLPEAIKTTITKTGPAVLYAMLATCMGFIAMFLSPIPMMQGFGLVSIIGVVTCYITSLIGIPLIAILINYKAKGHGVSKFGTVVDHSLSKTAIFIAKRPVPILLVVLLLAIIGFQLDPMIPVDTNEKAFVPPDMPAKANLDKVTRNIGSTDSVPILIRGSDVMTINTMKWMKEFIDFEQKSKTKIIRSSSILDYLVAYNNGVLPKTQSELEQVLDRIPENIKETYVRGNNEALFEFYTVKLETQSKSDLKKNIEGDLRLYPPPPGIQANITGDFGLFTLLVDYIIESKEPITYAGFILVVLFLALVYRNIYAITPIVPIFAIVGWNAVAMYVMGITYNPMTACLGSMTIGVAAEYTILVMERYIEEREKTDNVIEALQSSVSRIGSAIMVSGFATFFGFSALILSTFPIISNFGLTTIIAVLFSLIGAIVVMPAILAFIDQVIHGVEEIEEGISSHHLHPQK